MEDILMELPWYCDDCETWHKEFIWAHDDGTYSSCDEDGDHEPIDEEDIPSFEEHDRRWREYNQWVLEHGEDPLGNYFVKYSTKVNERWQFKFSPTLVGPRLIGSRRAGRAYSQAELPEHVTSFLNLDASGKLGDFSSWEGLIEVLPGIKANKWTTCHIDNDRPRSDTVVARELRAIARRALKEVKP